MPYDLWSVTRLLGLLLPAMMTACFQATPSSCAISCASGTCPSGMTCNAQELCTVGGDVVCSSRVDGSTSDSNVSVPETCGDDVANGNETDVDCGGPCPTLCEFGQGCAEPEDCATANCTTNDICGPVLTLGTFGEPRNVTELNSDGIEAVHWVSPDGLTIYMTVETSGTVAANMIATRPALDADFEEAVLIENINSDDYDGGAFQSANGLELFFHTTHESAGTNRNLALATRASTADEFNAPNTLTVLNSSSFDAHPNLSWDGLTLYYTSWRHGGLEEADIWFSTRDSLDADFVAPTKLVDLPEAEQDMAPVLSYDGLRLYFTRGSGEDPSDEDSYDIYYVERSTSQSAFDNPQPLGSVNTVGHMEFKYVYSANGCAGFWSSNRPGSQGDYDIWTHTNPECLK